SRYFPLFPPYSPPSVVFSFPPLRVEQWKTSATSATCAPSEGRLVHKCSLNKAILFIYVYLLSPLARVGQLSRLMPIYPVPLKYIPFLSFSLCTLPITLDRVPARAKKHHSSLYFPPLRMAKPT